MAEPYHHTPDTPDTIEDAVRRAFEDGVTPAEIRNARIIGALCGLAILAVLCLIAALAIASRGGV